MLRRWYVVTPEYGTVIPVLDDGTGPMEYVGDVVEVEAETRRDAIALGVRLMLKGSRREFRWCRDQRDSGLSPYSGVKAERAPSVEAMAHYDTCGLCGEGEMCDVGRALLDATEPEQVS